MRFGQFAQLPASGISVSSFLSNDTESSAEQDVLLDPSYQVADGPQNARFFAAVPAGVKGSLKRPLLFRLWQLRDLQRMANTDLVGQERLCDGWNSIPSKRNRVATYAGLRPVLEAIRRRHHSSLTARFSINPFIGAGLLQRMHAFALPVLNELSIPRNFDVR